jgi:nucleoside-diphosphate-sugar epimerase
MRGNNKYIVQLSHGHRLDVIDFSHVRASILSQQAALVIHAASPASVVQMLDGPKDIVESNVVLTLEVCEAIASAGGHLTFLSSGEVYGPNAPIPTRESDYSAFDHLSTRGSYPELKRAAEVIIQTWSKAHNFSASSLRVYHTFGPGLRETDERIFSEALKSVLRNEDICLNSTGEATRSFLYVLDLVTAISATRQGTGFEEYNVASDAEISILSFAQKAATLNKEVQVIVPNEVENLTGTPNRSPILRGGANTSKLQSMGWSQSVDLGDALSRTLHSMKWRVENGFSNFSESLK